MSCLRSKPLLALLIFGGLSTPHGLADETEQLAFFERHIRPQLVQHCYECHSADGDNVEGGFRLDSRQAIRRGGDSGEAVVPGKPADSLLLSALRYEGLEMPPEGKLPPDVIANFERWIAEGAIDPRDNEAPVAQTEINFEQGRDFWSFQPIQPQPLPQTVSDWGSNRIDRFVLASMESQELEPCNQADRATLVRRLSIDLIGLPPNARQVQAYVQDDRPGAYDRMVDRLLSSPRLGERWARLWLDVARYAEDQAHIVGNNKSLFYPNAYLYRDWVISAFNHDLAYDDFVRQQLAADLLPDTEAADVAALGFLGLGPKYYRRNTPEVMADEWEDRIDVVSRGLMGLTVACARCHDHKFDPIGTEDYYALAGIFASTSMFNRPLDDEQEKGNSGEAKNPSQSLHVVRDVKARDLPVYLRGDVKNHGPVVPRRFLRVLCDGEPTPFKQGSGRLELAEAIASRDNPLTARVIVNRVWRELVGQGLVTTPSNFGLLGQRPTHPELLDDLSARFIDADWSLKWLLREIVTSSTYQQSTRGSDESLAADPDNRWLSRMNRKRMSVEAWRDTLLLTAGPIASQLGGQSMIPTDPSEKRRTVYSKVSRFQLNTMLALFDFPDPNAHSAARSNTTTPLQKLFLMNDPFMVDLAERVARRVQAASQDPASQIHFAYEFVFGRAPTATELELGRQYLDKSTQPDAWPAYAQALLASNELLFVP